MFLLQRKNWNLLDKLVEHAPKYESIEPNKTSMKSFKLFRGTPPRFQQLLNGGRQIIFANVSVSQGKKSSIQGCPKSKSKPSDLNTVPNGRAFDPVSANQIPSILKSDSM